MPASHIWAWLRQLPVFGPGYFIEILFSMNTACATATSTSPTATFSLSVFFLFSTLSHLSVFARARRRSSAWVPPRLGRLHPSPPPPGRPGGRGQGLGFGGFRTPKSHHSKQAAVRHTASKQRYIITFIIIIIIITSSMPYHLFFSSSSFHSLTGGL